MKLQPALVVLAAGRGRRFANAAQAPGQPLGDAGVLAATLRNAVDSRLPVVVVAVPALAALATQLVAARDVVEIGDDEAARGVGHTIALGVGARSDAPGWVVLPADMPLVRPQTMRAVAAALDDHAVAVAQYRGRRGQPVGFAGELYSELMPLTGDDGARRLLARYPAFGVELDDPGVLVAIDTEADLLSARAAHAEASPGAD